MPKRDDTELAAESEADCTGDSYYRALASVIFDEFKRTRRKEPAALSQSPACQRQEAERRGDPQNKNGGEASNPTAKNEAQPDESERASLTVATAVAVVNRRQEIVRNQ